MSNTHLPLQGEGKLKREIGNEGLGGGMGGRDESRRNIVLLRLDVDFMSIIYPVSKHTKRHLKGNNIDKFVSGKFIYVQIHITGIQIQAPHPF